jgi:cyclic pyranopterin phosphate synthase
VDIVRGIASTPGIRTVTMTTNGLLLSRIAGQLADAGLKRVNISLDTLNPEKFKRLTRWGKLEDVWKGIQAAEEAGLTPIKLNAVVVKGYNEPDVVDLARLTLQHPWQIRFIEMMPFAGATDIQTGQVITAAEIQERIEDSLGDMQVANDGKLDGEARLFRLPNAKGDVGFISTVTNPFCASCTRARLTADGRLRLCLLREKEVDLLTPLRAGATLDDLRQIILDGVWEKPWGHGLEEGVIPLNRVMNQIGG